MLELCSYGDVELLMIFCVVCAQTGTYVFSTGGSMEES